MTRYEQITFRPEGARRSRTVILRDPKARGMFLTGVQMNLPGLKAGVSVTP
jgi:hypothetical protein